MLIGYHRSSNAGGGGERVLWTAIAYIQRTDPETISVVYSGDKNATKEEILDKVKVCQACLSHICPRRVWSGANVGDHFLKDFTLFKARFAISLSPELVHFVFLESRRYVEDSTWPRFTLLGQSLGSMYLVWEAMGKLIPDLYIGE